MNPITIILSGLIALLIMWWLLGDGGFDDDEPFY